MTCIVGVQGESVAVIGGDSAAVSGWVVQRYGGGKVFRRGAFLYGAAGDRRMSDVLQWQFDPPARDGESLDVYMHTAYLDALRECMKAKGYAKVDNSVEGMGNGSFLVAVEGVLYAIDSDFQIWTPGDGYTALGCGYAIALGSLYATRGQEARKRVWDALYAAGWHNGGVCQPFVVETVGVAV